MGWDVVDKGLKIVLSNEVPKLVKEKIPAEIKTIHKNFCPSLLPLLILAVLKCLMPWPMCYNFRCTVSQETLSDYGNMEFVLSVLLTLERFFKHELPLQKENQTGIMLGRWPRFLCAELNVSFVPSTEKSRE